MLEESPRTYIHFFFYLIHIKKYILTFFINLSLFILCCIPATCIVTSHDYGNGGCKKIVTRI